MHSLPSLTSLHSYYKLHKQTQIDHAQSFPIEFTEVNKKSACDVRWLITGMIDWRRYDITPNKGGRDTLVVIVMVVICKYSTPPPWGILLDITLWFGVSMSKVKGVFVVIDMQDSTKWQEVVIHWDQVIPIGNYTSLDWLQKWSNCHNSITVCW